LGLKRGAETLGFNARAVKTSEELLNQMNEAPLPAIIHWKGNHWVVLHGKKGKKCVVADPAVGIRYLSSQEIAESWTDWLMLLLEPDPVKFYANENDEVGGFWRFFKRC
jgi:ATP-binding cassette, subfamily C, bacterial